MARRVFHLAVATLAALVLAGTAGAGDIPQAGGANNIVMVSTTGTGMTLSRGSTQVAQVAGPTVGSTNIASATASNCVGCHSTAVAVQAIFVVGSPQFYVPGNAATAVNAGCDGCVSFAYAWQYVVQVPGPVHLTTEGLSRIQDLRQQISDAASTSVNSIDDALALCTTLNDLTARLKSVIDGDLIASGVSATGTPNEHVDVTNGTVNATC